MSDIIIKNGLMQRAETKFKGINYAASREVLDSSILISAVI